MAKMLWTEAYRPKSISEYVFQDEHQQRQINKWIEEQSLPNLLITGVQGTGKTTIAKVLFNELNIEPLDILEINASRTNSIDDVRNKIVNFVQMIPFGDFKVVLLDEADFLSINSQAALRGVFEEYHSTARFILTANYPQKIIPALHSRCQGFHITKLDKTEFTARIAQILINENIEFDLDTLDSYVRTTYPDLRKCINLVQMNSDKNKLNQPSSSDSIEQEWRFDMVNLFKQGKIQEARQLVCGKAKPEEIEDIYKWLYQNIEIFKDKQDDAILIIKQGLVDHTIVVDPEINLAATLIRLSRM